MSIYDAAGNQVADMPAEPESTPDSEACPDCGAVNWGLHPDGQSECVTCGYVDPAPEICKYGAAHAAARVTAVTVIDCGAVGLIPSCQTCADFYARMS